LRRIVPLLSSGVLARNAADSSTFHERYSTAAQLSAMQATIPMNRLGTPDECAGTVLYLASDTMDGYVTGQIVEVNGGQYMP
jgi:3-oxoacyl-[acyl-carrier protein] reductase